VPVLSSEHNATMRSRRFLLLAASLMALNTALWLAPQGLALRQSLNSVLFGKNMVRADVTENDGAEWRIDRGIVVSSTPTLLTLQEADTKIQPIVISSSTKVMGGAGSPFKLKNIKPGWRVLVTWPALSGPAVSVVIEKKHA
jgi:hypothetical protein